MEELNHFLQKQTIMQIAPHAGDPWVANVLMISNEASALYFIGNKNTQYGQKLLEDSRLAFATAWHHESNHLDRKGIQGVGTATVVEDETEVTTAVTQHNQEYPEFAERITPEWIRENDKGSCVWKITPEYIKFWNDELYGQDGSKEFTF